jgi:peptidylprolyl isomerase
VPAPPDVAAPPPTATKLPNGIAVEVLTPGTGTEHPNAWDNAVLEVTIWTTDGKMFETTQGKRPLNFPLQKIVPGWSLAFQQLTVGERARFWIPAELAFKGRPGPQGTNVIEAQLISIEKHPAPPPPPPVPEDVKAPAADARKQPDGLAIKTLKPGTGTVHPKVSDTVLVDYSGWTTDGKMFDSSRGTPIPFPLASLIDGWKEGIPLMVEGEKARMWIPAELAYKGRGGPQGMLVFDIELMKINPPANQPPPAPAPH